ncbi:MAG: 5-(carboxyamino)imidazole ribonucleotide synthase, partial [Nitratireductor sp.]
MTITNKTLKSGDTIGILGGGQLGRMLSVAASRLGLKTIVLEPNIDCPAAQTCNRHIVAEYDEPSALEELVKSCDVITYEFENIPSSSVHYLEEHIALLPNSTALEKSQDRLIEKEFLNNLGISTAPFFVIDTLSDLEQVVASDAFQKCANGILKTRRMGYDGKGQSRISASATSEELNTAWQETGEVPCVLEGFVDFECEISIIIARAIDGDTACFEPAQNVHKDGILHTSTVPSNASNNTKQDAKELATKIANALNYVGVMGVEFFVLKDGSLVVNE